jgi:hypothetical protein
MRKASKALVSRSNPRPGFSGIAAVPFLTVNVGLSRSFPIHSAYRHLGLFPEGPELRYLAQLVVTGGLLWFGVGLLLRMLLSLLVTLLPNRE